MRTWRFPRFSALLMLLRASARTFMRTMVPAGKKRDSYICQLFSTETLSSAPFLRLILDLKDPRLTGNYIKPSKAFLG